MTIHPKSLGKVAVLFGGLSAEREVSMMSGQGVLAALQSVGVDAHPFDPANQALQDLQTQGFDRAFIALHGRYGEDGCVQGALELLKIPYTGSGVTACAVAMDKVLTKRIWQTYQLPTPRYVALTKAQGTRERLRELPDQLGLPMIMKPPHEGSTIGVTKISGYSDVMQAFELAAKYDDVVLAEEFIAGRELTIAILGSGDAARALPIIEIIAPGGNYDFENKYIANDTRYICPAQLDADLTQRIQAICLDAYKALGCEGWARADVMLRSADNEPFLLEINASPGMTSHSLVPMAAKQFGLDYAALCLEILSHANLKMEAKTR